MNEIEIQFDASTAVHLETEFLPTSASLSVKRPNGAILEAPTVAINSHSSTVSTPGLTSLTLSSVTGLAVGYPLQVTSDGVRYTARIARIDGTTVHLSESLPVLPDASSPVTCPRLSATLAAPGSSAVGAGYRLVWAYANATETRQESLGGSVVRYRWAAPVSARDVRETVATLFGESPSEDLCAAIARRANTRLYSKICESGLRANMFLGTNVLASASDAALRYQLALDGHALGGDPYAAQRETRFAFEDAILQLLKSAAPRDTNEDGALSPNELRPFSRTIRVVR